jgi:hypothetical protein
VIAARGVLLASVELKIDWSHVHILDASSERGAGEPDE